jgi:hypothetical protein
MPALSTPRTLKELAAERRKARALSNPEAFRFCEILSKARKRLLQGVLASIGLNIVLGVVFDHNVVGSLFWYVDQLTFYLPGGFLALYIVLSLIRFAVVAIVFARYSIKQVFGFVMIVNVLASLAVLLPGGWKAFPIAMLGCLIIAALVYVAIQDPEESSYTPGFMRKLLSERRAQKHSLELSKPAQKSE